jgi:hypothetical protein
MIDEPAGETIDGTPWEEARPPHLPDRLTSITPWVLPFVAVMGYEIWRLWARRGVGNLGSPLESWLGSYAVLTGILGVLLGLALFLRHPDARTTLTPLASGTFLLLLQHVMRRLGPTVVGLLPGEQLSFPYVSPTEEAYSLFVSIVGVFATAFIARGLSAARRYEDVRTGRGLAAVLTIVAFASTGASIVWMTSVGFEFDDWLMHPVLVIGQLLVNLFGTLAVAYLVVVSVTGWLGQEQPRAAWRLATVGAGLILLPALVMPVISTPPLSQDVAYFVASRLAVGAVIGWALLVVAFALGLPSTESIPDEETAGATRDPQAVTTPGSGAG